MAGDGGERRQRMLDLLDTIYEAQRLSSITLSRAAMKKWLITPRTAAQYIDGLISAGWVANKQGILEITALGSQVWMSREDPATKEHINAQLEPPPSPSASPAKEDAT